MLFVDQRFNRLDLNRADVGERFVKKDKAGVGFQDYIEFHHPVHSPGKLADR